MKDSLLFYPVYLYYKDLETLILAYGVSETEEFSKTWPAEILNSGTTIESYFNRDVPRYGDSFVFKSYKVKIAGEKITYLHSDNQLATEKDIESDLQTILDYYRKTVSIETASPTSVLGQGLFYMESQLEDFIINNWNNTELGKKYDLIIEEGELVSQQFKTDIGPIDILAKDKKIGSYVVIELKKNQTSDDTIGQIARYIGWVKKHRANGKGVKGIIIAGSYDKKLDYAIKAFEGLDIDVYLYKVDFQLSEFKN